MSRQTLRKQHKDSFVGRGLALEMKSKFAHTAFGGDEQNERGLSTLSEEIGETGSRMRKQHLVSGLGSASQSTQLHNFTF